MTLSFAPFLSDEENLKRFAAAAPIADTPVVDEPPSQEVNAAAKSPKSSRKPVKKVVDVYACIYSCRQCWASKCRGL
jgi:hypothetical protein